jgi:acetoin utilization protein AcuC
MSFELNEYLPIDLALLGRGPAWVPGDDRLALVHSDEYAGWAFSAGHPTQGRRFMNARERLLLHAPEAGVEVVELAPELPALAELGRVHDLEYVNEVVLGGRSGEWSGERRDLGRLALLMAGGTLTAARALLSGVAHTAVHFAGAKHHAMRDRSSGFCVFNDLAFAAKAILDGDSRVYCPTTMRWKPVERISIIDFDAHHGDGTEALLRDDDRVQTLSVHDRSIFPGTGRFDDEGCHVFNCALEPGSGDDELGDAVSYFVGLGQRFRPDMVFVAMGADGHLGDPLSTLGYTTDGLVETARMVRRGFWDVPMLLGGAGGYQPDDVTPNAWARMAVAAAMPVEHRQRFWVDIGSEMDYCLEPEDDEEMT